MTGFKKKSVFMLPASCLPALLLALLPILGCGYAYLDPGSNPARVAVSVKAQAPQADLPSRGAVVLWDWGLYVVGADGLWKRLGPTQTVKFTAMPANPLEQDLVFLAPSGKHKLVLSLEGYVMVDAGDQTVARTVAKYGDSWQVDLKPGQEWKIVKTYGTN